MTSPNRYKPQQSDCRSLFLGDVLGLTFNSSCPVVISCLIYLIGPAAQFTAYFSEKWGATYENALNFVQVTGSGEKAVTVPVADLVIAGWTGRDP